MRPDPPQTFYSDNVGYRDHLDDDIEALASRALNPISDFPPGADYDMDHSITSSEYEDDSDLSLSDEEGQRDAAALRSKTNNILNEFEEFVQDVSLPASTEIMNSLIGVNNGNVRRKDETIKSRLTAGVKDAILQREWNYGDRRNLHDMSSDGDEGFGLESEKYEKKRGFFKYTMPLFHSMKFKIVSIIVAVLFVAILIIGSRDGHEEKVIKLNIGENESEDEVVSWFYLETECSDHPTAEVHGEGHGCSWIHNTGRVPLRHARCGHDTTHKKRNGEFLKVKEICKLSCDECDVTSNNIATEAGTQQSENENDSDTKNVDDTETQTGNENNVNDTETQTENETQTELVPEALLEKYPTTTVLSIDTTKCEDHPTAYLDANDHTCENFIAHVGRVNLHDARCSHETPLRDENGTLLLVKDVCRLSCGECGGTEELLEEYHDHQQQHVQEEMNNVVGENESEDEVVSWFYLETECSDHPTAEVHGEGHDCSWIHNTGRVPLRHARCGHDTTHKKRNGEFLKVKEICKLSCDECDVSSTNNIATEAGAQQSENENDSDTKNVDDTETQTGNENNVNDTETQTENETQTELVPEALLEKYPTTTVLSIDTTKCEDHPTAYLDANDHTCENFIAHVGRVNLHDARCSHETPLRDENDTILLVKDVCRLSCEECGGAEELIEEQAEAEEPQAQSVEIGSMAQASNTSTSESGAIVTNVGEMTNWMEPVTLSSQCFDDPNKVVAVGGKTCETYFRDSSLVHLQQLRCSHRTDIRDETGNQFLFVKDICRKSCGLCGFDNGNEGVSPASTGQNNMNLQDHPLQEDDHASDIPGDTDSVLMSSQQTQESGGKTSIQSLPDPGMHEQKAYDNIAQRFEPVWYDRTSGWQGTTHAAAVEFCSSFDDTLFLCPYEAYCPMGTSTTVPFGGRRGESNEVYAAAINGPTLWVHVGGGGNICNVENFDENWGSENTMIMCCKK